MAWVRCDDLRQVTLARSVPIGRSHRETLSKRDTNSCRHLRERAHRLPASLPTRNFPRVQKKTHTNTHTTDNGADYKSRPQGQRTRPTLRRTLLTSPMMLTRPSAAPLCGHRSTTRRPTARHDPPGSIIVERPGRGSKAPPGGRRLERKRSEIRKTNGADTTQSRRQRRSSRHNDENMKT